MTKLLEAVAVAALLAIYAMNVVHWGELPERFPTHFNAAGDLNGWSGKYGALAMPVIATGMYVFLTVVSRKARRFNVPSGVNQDAPEVRAELRQLLSAIKALVLVMFAYVHGGSMAVAMGRADGLGRAFLPAFLVVTFGVVAIYLVRLRRFRLNTGLPR